MTTPSLALPVRLPAASARAVAQAAAFPALVLGLVACVAGYAAVALLLLRWVLGLL